MPNESEARTFEVSALSSPGFLHSLISNQGAVVSSLAVSSARRAGWSLPSVVWGLTIKDAKHVRYLMYIDTAQEKSKLK